MLKPTKFLLRSSKTSRLLDFSHHMFANGFNTSFDQVTQSLNGLKNIDLSKANENHIESQEVSLLHIDYDKYSAEKDPADKLFKTFFGETWTENFINNFLFTLNHNPLQ